MAYLSINEMKFLAKLRNLDGYENMSRKQPENIFSIASSPKPVLGPKKPIPPSRSEKRTPLDETEKNSDNKNRQTQKLQTIKYCTCF